MQSIYRINRAMLSVFALAMCASAMQTKPTIAVLNIDTKGLVQDSRTMGNLVRLELEKTGVFEVVDNYEVSDVLAKGGVSIDSCFSKSCVVKVGKLLGVDKMLAGNAERMGEKIVITLRLLYVASGTIEKSDVTEFQNLPEVQKMVRISVAKIAGLEPDPVLSSVLLDFNTPIENPNASFTNNGPRVAVSYTMPGIASRRFQASRSIGGYDAPLLDVTMGWQQEVSYYSAGQFQALLEFVPAIGGFSYDMFIPSMTILQGFRLGKLGLEFALGPNFRLMRMGRGYFTSFQGTPPNVKPVENSWVLGSPPGVSTVELPDSRGDFQLKTNLLVAAGITIHSGYLNLPVNVYVVPKKAGQGTTWGLSLGFNMTHKRKQE